MPFTGSQRNKDGTAKRLKFEDDGTIEVNPEQVAGHVLTINATDLTTASFKALPVVSGATVWKDDIVLADTITQETSGDDVLIKGGGKLTVNKTDDTESVFSVDPATPGEVTFAGTGATLEVMNISNDSVYVGVPARNLQSQYSVTIGKLAGNSLQGSRTVAIGFEAGKTYQSQRSVAIGQYAGKDTQGTDSVAIGSHSGELTQAYSSVAIGSFAGYNGQVSEAVAVGSYAGYYAQKNRAVAVGTSAGDQSQNELAIAIGFNTGYASQGARSVAIGANAAQTTQLADSVAIGFLAGNSGQRDFDVAIGHSAGKTAQQTKAIAIGHECGFTTQGANAVAVGYRAGYTNQAANSIVLNASGAALENTTANSLVVKPVRNVAAATTDKYPLHYDATTGEVAYDLQTNTFTVHVTNGPETGSGFVGNTRAVILRAYDALPATGGTIIFGPGTWTIDSTSGFPSMTKNTRLVGAGRELTIITDSTSSAASFMVFTTGSYFELRDLSIVITQASWIRALNITIATGGQLVMYGCYVETPAGLAGYMFAMVATGTVERAYIAHTHFKTLDATNGSGVALNPLNTTNLRIENCDFEIAYSALSLTIDGPSTYAEQTVCHMDGCRFIGTSSLNLSADVQLFLSQCVLPKLYYTNSGAVPGAVTQNPRIVITGCTPANAADLFFNLYFAAQASMLTTNLTIITDGSRVSTGASANYGVGANNTVNLVIRSTDNGADLQFNTNYLTGVTTSDILVELPVINRSKSTINGLANQINGMLALSNDYGWIRRVSGAWVQQLTNATTLDVTNMSIGGVTAYNGLPTLITAPANHDGLMYDSVSGKWINMAHAMPIVEASHYDINTTPTSAMTAMTATFAPFTYSGLVYNLVSNSDPSFTSANSAHPTITIPAIQTQLYHIAVSLCGYVTTTGMTLEIALRKNGTTLDRTRTRWDVGTVPDSFAFHAAETFASGDEVLLVARYTNASKTLYMYNINLVMMGSKHVLAA
jgi:hypothetical protein